MNKKYDLPELDDLPEDFDPLEMAAFLVATDQGGLDRDEVLLVTKHAGDASALAFPAGMVEPGASVPQTLRAELTEEA
ncbi:MAG: NUDIX domain-containing protein, partial [Alphaproteobacteria bacterium]